MDDTSRAYARLAWLALFLAAAFALLQLVDVYRESLWFPSQWPLKVGFEFLVAFFGLAVMSSRGSAA